MIFALVAFSSSKSTTLSGGNSNFSIFFVSSSANVIRSPFLSAPMFRCRRRHALKRLRRFLHIGGFPRRCTYANWEYGLRDPDTDTLAILAELFEVSIDYLKGLDDVPMVRESQSKYIINDQARNAVIEEYLRLPPHDRKIVDDIIKALSEKHKK
jgi:transcriptional regulator with XRE-family HTH domain